MEPNVLITLIVFLIAIGLIIWGRWDRAVVGILAVAVMVWRILKYRNTQSATGVLFVGVILTFIGEMTGTLLFRSLSLPL